MKRGMFRGVLTGMLIGGTAATMFGIVNWQTERAWNRQMRHTGRALTRKTDELLRKI